MEFLWDCRGITIMDMTDRWPDKKNEEGGKKKGGGAINSPVAPRLAKVLSPILLL